VALKQLASQTAVYGLSSMLGRFLNYLLVPIHTGVFVPSEYGVVSDVYAMSAFVAVLLTLGIETAFFRYVNKSDSPSQLVMGNSFLILLVSVFAFWGITLFNTGACANWLGYANNPEYITWMALSLGFDALSAIPMAQLRQLNKPILFAGINFANIGVNIGINLLFVWYGMDNIEASNWFMDNLFDPTIGVGYVFLANTFASGAKFLLLIPTILRASFRIDRVLIQQLLLYGLPLMVASFAGIINETLDRRLIRILLEPKMGETEALAQVGIYSACYKLSIIITLFIQAFRYAAEPFFFSRAKEKNSPTTYATVMTWFTVAVSAMMVFVLLYLDVLKRFIDNDAYWEGLHIVPILLIANICLGWNYNLAIWYKLTNQTKYGAYLAGIGAVITIGANWLLIPRMGYTGAAWATLLSYSGMTIISYIWGQRKMYVPYDLKKLLGYPALGFGIYLISIQIPVEGIMHWIVNTGLLAVYLIAIATLERNQLKGLLS
jgi:O-antigen/teichoic acid export membrane protein